MLTPVVVTWLSTSRSGLCAPSSRNSRLPPPTTTGSIITPELVDQVVLDQRLQQLAAGDHVQVLAVLLVRRATASATSSGALSSSATPAAR
jgi:hypothetical protein